MRALWRCPERQSARMSEIKNVGYTWMAKFNQLTPLPFTGLKFVCTELRVDKMPVYFLLVIKSHAILGSACISDLWLNDRVCMYL